MALIKKCVSLTEIRTFENQGRCFPGKEVRLSSPVVKRTILFRSGTLQFCVTQINFREVSHCILVSSTS